MRDCLINNHWIEYLDHQNCIVWSIDYCSGFRLYHDSHLEEFIQLYLDLITPIEYLHLVACDTEEIDLNNLTGMA